MTRLVSDMIEAVPSTLDELDRRLLRLVGCDLKELACGAAGIPKAELERCRLRSG